jgi:hypothetical protein
MILESPYPVEIIQTEQTSSKTAEKEKKKQIAISSRPKDLTFPKNPCFLLVIFSSLSVGFECCVFVASKGVLLFHKLKFSFIYVVRRA